MFLTTLSTKLGFRVRRSSSHQARWLLFLALAVLFESHENRKAELSGDEPAGLASLAAVILPTRESTILSIIPSEFCAGEKSPQRFRELTSSVHDQHGIPSMHFSVSSIKFGEE